MGARQSLVRLAIIKCFPKLADRCGRFGYLPVVRWCALIHPSVQTNSSPRFNHCSRARGLSGFLRVVKSGCPTFTAHNNWPSLDFIEFFEKREPRIFEIIDPLYQKGMSITDIANETGLKRTSIWTALRHHKRKLRAQSSISFDKWRRRNGKTKARPPYGYCYFEGAVVKNPAEYPTLLLIRSLRKQGKSISAIIQHLEGNGIKSRMKKPWSYNVVKSIVNRSYEPVIEETESKVSNLNVRPATSRKEGKNVPGQSN